MWEVLETSKVVAEKSLQVTLDKQAINNFGRALAQETIVTPSWNSPYHLSGLSGKKDDLVAYLLVLDSINFCFWPLPGNPRWEITHQSEKLSGYYALAASLKKAFESGVPLTNAQYLADLSLEKLKRSLEGTGNLQLLNQRVQSLNELGQLLEREYNGKAYNIVEAAQQSAIHLVRLLAEKLPSFQDKADYQGEKVLFYKRAQLFAADLYGALEGKDGGYFHDIDRLTAFADYKVPQVLRQVGVLRYEQALAHKVDHHILLPAGSPEEVEIRANTIWAVELICQEVMSRGKNLKAIEIDWALWNLGQHEDYRAKPYHRTITVFY